MSGASSSGRPRTRVIDEALDRQLQMLINKYPEKTGKPKETVYNTAEERAAVVQHICSVMGIGSGTGSGSKPSSATADEKVRKKAEASVEKEKKKKEKEEEKRRTREEAEEKRKQEEAEEKRKQEEAEEKRKQEEAEEKRKQEEAEEERKREEAEEERKREEAEETRKKQEKAEEKRRKQEEREKKKKEKEDEKRRKKEEKKKQEEEQEKRRLEEAEEKKRLEEEEEKRRQEEEQKKKDASKNDKADKATKTKKKKKEKDPDAELKKAQYVQAQRDRQAAVQTERAARGVVGDDIHYDIFRTGREKRRDGKAMSETRRRKVEAKRRASGERRLAQELQSEAKRNERNARDKAREEEDVGYSEQPTAEEAEDEAAAAQAAEDARIAAEAEAQRLAEEAARVEAEKKAAEEAAAAQAAEDARIAAEAEAQRLVEEAARVEAEKKAAEEAAAKEEKLLDKFKRTASKAHKGVYDFGQYLDRGDKYNERDIPYDVDQRRRELQLLQAKTDTTFIRGVANDLIGSGYCNPRSLGYGVPRPKDTREGVAELGCFDDESNTYMTVKSNEAISEILQFLQTSFPKGNTLNGPCKTDCEYDPSQGMSVCRTDEQESTMCWTYKPREVPAAGTHDEFSRSRYEDFRSELNARSRRWHGQSRIIPRDDDIPSGRRMPLEFYIPWKYDPRRDIKFPFEVKNDADRTLLISWLNNNFRSYYFSTSNDDVDNGVLPFERVGLKEYSNTNPGEEPNELKFLKANPPLPDKFYTFNRVSDYFNNIEGLDPSAVPFRSDLTERERDVIWQYLDPIINKNQSYQRYIPLWYDVKLDGRYNVKYPFQHHSELQRMLRAARELFAKNAKPLKGAFADNFAAALEEYGRALKRLDGAHKSFDIENILIFKDGERIPLSQLPTFLDWFELNFYIGELGYPSSLREGTKVKQGPIPLQIHLFGILPQDWFNGSTAEAIKNYLQYDVSEEEMIFRDGLKFNPLFVYPDEAGQDEREVFNEWVHRCMNPILGSFANKRFIPMPPEIEGVFKTHTPAEYLKMAILLDDYFVAEQWYDEYVTVDDAAYVFFGDPVYRDAAQKWLSLMREHPDPSTWREKVPKWLYENYNKSVFNVQPERDSTEWWEAKYAEIMGRWSALLGDAGADLGLPWLDENGEPISDDQFLQMAETTAIHPALIKAPVSRKIVSLWLACNYLLWDMDGKDADFLSLPGRLAMYFPRDYITFTGLVPRSYMPERPPTPPQDEEENVAMPKPPPGNALFRRIQENARRANRDESSHDDKTASTNTSTTAQRDKKAPSSKGAQREVSSSTNATAGKGQGARGSKPKTGGGWFSWLLGNSK